MKPIGSSSSNKTVRTKGELNKSISSFSLVILNYKTLIYKEKYQ